MHLAGRPALTIERSATDHVCLSEFRRRVAEDVAKPWERRAPLRVTRQNAMAVVVLSEAGSMMETLYLLKIPANAARFLRSIRGADFGKLAERDVLEFQ